VRLSGSVEIAPGLGLADCIVDVVETGRTLLENGLEAVEDVAVSSARLVVNGRATHARRAEGAGADRRAARRRVKDAALRHAGVFGAGWRGCRGRARETRA